MRGKDEFVELFKQTGEKFYELVSLERRSGSCYLATMYNRVAGYYKEQVFLYYTKKEVIHKLRNEYGCIVRKGVIMSKVINARASFGYVGAVHEDQFEVPDSYTEVDIDKMVREWAQQFVETDWEEEVFEDEMD